MLKFGDRIGVRLLREGGGSAHTELLPPLYLSVNVRVSYIYNNQ